MGQPLAELLHMKRFKYHASMREVAGINASVIHRIEAGKDSRLSTIAKVIEWMRLTPYELAQLMIAEAKEANSGSNR